MAESEQPVKRRRTPARRASGGTRRPGSAPNRAGAPRRALSDEALRLIASRFKALSEPTRLKLIIALEEGEKNVGELVAATQATQANVSRHLQTLTEAGILSRRKEGLNVYYSVGDPTIYELCEHVCGSLQRRLAQQAKVFT